jgi:NitT/TauT family transport system substrate-binding protein
VLSVYWDDYVADAKGMWAANGLQLETTLADTTAGAIRALLSSAADIASSIPDGIPIANAQGGDIVDVCDVVLKTPYALAVGKSVESYTDLKGKKVAISDPKSGATVVVKNMLRANGVQESEVELVSSGGSTARFAALQTGAVDAAVVVPPFDLQLQDLGFRILGYASDKGAKSAFVSVQVRKSWVQQPANAELLVRYLRAKKQALAWLNDPKNREEATQILAAKLKLSPDIATRTYDLVFSRLQMFSKDIGVDADAVQDVISQLVAVGSLKEPAPKATEFQDGSFAERARSG